MPAARSDQMRYPDQAQQAQPATSQPPHSEYPRTARAHKSGRRPCNRVRCAAQAHPALAAQRAGARMRLARAHRGERTGERERAAP